MNKIKDILKNNKKYAFLILVLVGVCLIGISYLPHKSTSDNTRIETNYEQNLEMRTKEIIEKIAGRGTTEVMITLKNTYSFSEQSKEVISFDRSEKNQEYKELPAPDIAGVMIVCTSLDNAEDFQTVKQAVSTCLDIPKSKIYIIGGTNANEKNP